MCADIQHNELPAGQPSETERSPVLVSGASGLIGSHVCQYLAGSGHRIGRLVRREGDPARGEISWRPGEGRVDTAALAGYPVVVHLSGENLMGRWTAQKRKRIHDSRVNSTRLLAEALASLEQRPRVLLCASAIGYYGNRDDELLTEESYPGRGFLADLCGEWEQAADAARAAGIRVVHMRFGLVLTRAGGVLAKMLTPFRLGVGGIIGSGRQWVSWIDMTDLVRAVEFLIVHEDVAGPVNFVSPKPLTNAEFTRALGSVLHRPTLMFVPAVVVRFGAGAMADETVLASTRVLPQRLTSAGFQFKYADMINALRHELVP